MVLSLLFRNGRCVSSPNDVRPHTSRSASPGWRSCASRPGAGRSRSPSTWSASPATRSATATRAPGRTVRMGWHWCIQFVLECWKMRRVEIGIFCKSKVYKILRA